jgi:hypothetical protein
VPFGETARAVDERLSLRRRSVVRRRDCMLSLWSRFERDVFCSLYQSSRKQSGFLVE